MHPHPALSQALSHEIQSDRIRVARRSRFRPSGGAAVREFRPVGHGRRVAATAACAGCPTG
jgi:hypothetical protein